MTNKTDIAHRVAFLDYLRIFAFLSVLMGHKFYADIANIASDDSVHATLRLLANALLPLILGGGAGVVVFFLISGYIILHVLQTTPSLDFFIKRIFRIYPLYIFAVLLHCFIIKFIDHGIIDYKLLVPQLLLIGDFFNVPHTLAGVEWTLRIEVLFYSYMFLMSYFQLTTKYKTLLPWAFLITVLLIGVLPAFPNKLWDFAYLNFYSPFLFLGAVYWLYEHEQIQFTFLAFFAAIVLFQYCHLISVLSPAWRYHHFSMLAIILFTTAWMSRTKLPFNKAVFFFSELTYGVYLTHNWLFEYIKTRLILKNIPHPRVYALLILLLVCAGLVRLIERPGVKLGQKFIKYLKRSKGHDTVDFTKPSLTVN